MEKVGIKKPTGRLQTQPFSNAIYKNGNILGSDLGGTEDKLKRQALTIGIIGAKCCEYQDIGKNMGIRGLYGRQVAFPILC